jgi:hypothetical protein
MNLWLLRRRRNARRGQVITQMADVLFAAHAAVVGTVQCADNTVQLDLHARAVARFDDSAEVVQEGLDIAPVDIATQGFLKDDMEETFVTVTHSGVRSWSVNAIILHLA